MSSPNTLAPPQRNFCGPVDIGAPRIASMSSEATSLGREPRGRNRDPGLQIAIVDNRSLMRDCFGRNLSLLEPTLEFRTYSGVAELIGTDRDYLERARIVVMCVEWSKPGSDDHLSDIGRLKEANAEIDVVLLSDIDEPVDILRAIETGARGNIPTSVSLEVAIKAMLLVAAGGIYIPEHLLVWLEQEYRRRSRPSDQDRQTSEIFTSRQMSVIDALRRGKPNKIIAYELNMCESTVKVHIRTIMKKLKARNRTEVAFKLNDMMFQPSGTGAPQTN